MCSTCKEIMYCSIKSYLLMYLSDQIQRHINIPYCKVKMTRPKLAPCLKQNNLNKGKYNWPSLENCNIPTIACLLGAGA